MAEEERSGPRTVAGSESELIPWMIIQDANSAGFIHGGVVMRMCDEVAGIAAIRHSGCRVVTAGVGRMTFTKAVPVGGLPPCPARRNAAGGDPLEGGGRGGGEDAGTPGGRPPPTPHP